MATLDTTAIQSAVTKSATSSPIMLPDGTHAARVEPLVTQTDWDAGTVYSGSAQIGASKASAMFAKTTALNVDGSTQVPYVACVMDAPTQGVSATVSIGAANPVSVGARLTAAPTAAQLPATLASPDAGQVSQPKGL